MTTPGTQLEQVITQGNLSLLSAEDRVLYYNRVCESVGLNPLTQPLQFITLNQKLVLYAKRDATDQLRKLHGVSIIIAAREVMQDTYAVTARATDKTGRQDESIGAVPIAGMKGEALANAFMKAETKAKRRVTLSICGLGMLDETEISSIPGAYPEPITPTAGAMQSLPVKNQEVVMDTASQVKALLLRDEAMEAYTLWQDSKFSADEEVAFWAQLDSKQRGVLKRMNEAERATEKNVISAPQKKRLEAIIKELKVPREAVKLICTTKYGTEHFSELTPDQYEWLCKNITDSVVEAETKTTSAPPVVTPRVQYIQPPQVIAIEERLAQNGIAVTRLLKSANVTQVALIPADDLNRVNRWIDGVIAKAAPGKQATTAALAAMPDDAKGII